MVLLVIEMYQASSVHLSKIARKRPIDAQKLSLTWRLRRFLDNEAVGGFAISVADFGGYRVSICPAIWLGGCTGHVTGKRWGICATQSDYFCVKCDSFLSVI